MTSTVTEVIITTIISSAYAVLSTTLGVIAVLLLLILLILKELIRTLDRPQAGIWMQTLDIVIVPLLLAFGLVIVVRLISL